MWRMYGVPSTGRQTIYFPFLGAIRGVVFILCCVFGGRVYISEIKQSVFKTCLTTYVLCRNLLPILLDGSNPFWTIFILPKWKNG